MELTPEEIARIRGSFVIKCVKAGGYTMTGHGQYEWSEGEERDLLDPDEELPVTLRAGDFWTARTMCADPSIELAQCIAAGDFEVVSEVTPDESVLVNLRQQG